MWKLLVLAALIGLDQYTKYLTVTALELGESAPFLPGFMQFTRVHNYGAAWSSFSGRTVWLVVMTTVLIIAVAVLLWKKVVRHPLGVAACLLVMGGGIGNYIDRVRLGYVVDMLDTLFIEYPVFNVADCFVVVGAILGAVYYLWFYEKYDMVKKDGTDDTSSN